MSDNPSEVGSQSSAARGSAGPRRVVLIAGLDDGRMAARFINEHPKADLVGLFVLDEKVGSVRSGFRQFDDLVEPPVLRKIQRIRDEVDAIKTLNPDIIVVVGFSEIITKDILSIPPMGVVGFHSAALPGRRGCSPLIWAMVDGLTETAVTMFYLDDGIDTGDVIAVEPFKIAEEDQAADVLKKADKATLSLLEQHLEAILDGTANRTKQDDAQCTYTRKRGAGDGEINWSRPSKDIVNLIRALSPPYPMAHTFGGDGVPILIEKARLAPELKVPAPKHDPSFQKRVLCVCAHPDDEVLGVGGTLVRHTEAGGEVVVIILSEGEDAKFEETPKCSTRRQSALNAAQVMGTKEVIFHDFPDQQLETVPVIDIIKAIEEAILDFRPEVIYTHHGGDANTDHHVVFKSTYAACRPMSHVGQSVKRLLTFETPSSTDQAPQIGEYVFTPNTFVSVDTVWKKKVAALECYPSEMIGGLHPRSFEYIECLARMRGGYSGVSHAEAFMLVRERLIP